MANRINNRRYNKLLSYRNRYYDIGGPVTISKIDPNSLDIPDWDRINSNTALNTKLNIPTLQTTVSTGLRDGLFRNLGATLKSGFQSGTLNGAATAVGDMVGGAIGGGLESGAGNVIGSLGNIASAIPGPWGAVAGAGLKVIGGLTNRMFGSKLNQENINAVQGNVNRLNNFQSNANSFDTLADTWGTTSLGTDFSNSYIGKDGWFSSKAKKKARQLRENMSLANAFVENSLQNNADNLTETTMNNLEANYAALGGFLHQYADGGGIHIDPKNRGKFTKYCGGKVTSECIAKGKRSSDPAVRKRATFAQNVRKLKHAYGGFLEGMEYDLDMSGDYYKYVPKKKAFGGDLNTNGADFSTGLTFIDNGGTHESNPYEGVPMGVAPDGKPNLVEEGEAIYNDYVFSNRLTVPKAVRNKYKLRGTNDLTFADAVKQLTKGATERPNDPISQETLNDIMTDLMTTQEELRIQQENNKFACGGKKGHLHANGDWLIGDDFFNNRDFTPSNLDANIPYSRSWNNNIGEGVSSKDFEDFTNYALTLDNNNPYWTGLSKATGKDINYLRSNYRALRSDGKYGYVSLTPKRVTQPSQANEWYTTVGRPGGDISFNPEYAGLFGYSIPKNVIGKSTLDNGDTINYVNNYPDTPTTQKPVTPITDKTDDTPLDLGTSDESLRYAPAIGLGLASITDAMGLTNKPDYGEASMIEAATRGGSYMPVSWNPIGNKLTYRPFDRDYYINKLNAESGATRRAIANQSGGNSGRAIAGLLAADYNTQDKLGDLFRKAEEYNLTQRQQVEDFNRATNQANSQGMLQADMANQQAYNSARDFNLRGIMAAAEMRQKARMASEAARSANLSGFLQALGDIGYENKGMNMIRRLAETGALGAISADHPLFRQYATSKAKKSLTKK